MRVELVKGYRFEAAHRLPNVAPDHKCASMHGHSYVIDVTLSGEVDPATGWLVDFGTITDIVEPLLRRELDHRTLNEVPGLENPTAENLCAWLWSRLARNLPNLSAITVHETCTARCIYRGPG